MNDGDVDLLEYTRDFYARKFKRDSVEQGAVYKGVTCPYIAGPRLAIVLTSECDIRQFKNEDTIMVAPLLGIDLVYGRWAEALSQRRVRLGKERWAPSKLKPKFISDVVTNNVLRYFFLPEINGAFQHCFACFDLVTGIPEKQLNPEMKLAVLQSPHKEALSDQFARLIGRIGTPRLQTKARIGIVNDMLNR